MPTTSRSRYLICFSNITDKPVEPNWMMRIPSACYICKSKMTLEEGKANWVTMACFHFAPCYEYLDWMIWKLGLSLPAPCIGGTMHHERICTCHFGIPPSWVRRDHSSRKSSQWASVTECRYCIHTCISYTHSQASLFITSYSQNRGQNQSATPLWESSRVLPRQFTRNIFLSCWDFHETCFLNP